MMRDFICTPSSWISCQLLNAVSEDAEMLFRRIAQCTDTDWKFYGQSGEMEHSIRTMCFASKQRFRAWSELRIRMALHELLATGLMIRCETSSKTWLEVGALWRYKRSEKGEVRSEKTKVPSQAELPMAGELSVMPAATAKNGKKTGDKSDKSDSRFARASDDSDDPLWGDLLRVIGLVEAHKNGAMWLKRLKLSHHALRAALSDFLSKDPAERSSMNAAAYITAAFENETRRSASAERKVG